MLSKNSTITIDTNWTELEEDFDISSFGLYCTSDIEVQEYGISGWGSSISVSASTPYFKNTSVEKLRVKTLSGTVDLNYSLWGLVISKLTEDSKLTYDGDYPCYIIHEE